MYIQSISSQYSHCLQSATLTWFNNIACSVEMYFVVPPQFDLRILPSEDTYCISLFLFSVSVYLFVSVSNSFCFS